MAKFYQQSLAERHATLIAEQRLTAAQIEQLKAAAIIAPEVADSMIENQIGQFPLPLGLAFNFLIDETSYAVPMVTEEPSVIAASSNAAKIVQANGGFTTTIQERAMIGQLIFTDVSDYEAAILLVQEKEAALIEIANAAQPSLVKRGGGLRRIETRIITDDDHQPAYFTVHLVVDVQEAMGANMMNTILEATATPLKEWLDSAVLMQILSNFADTSLVTATCRIEPHTLTTTRFEGEWLAKRIAEATRYAHLDPYRAATHNKGIMNGVDAVVLASGNDTRAIEAGAHAFAVRDGRYRGLSDWKVAENGDLVGQLTLPLPVGSVGGAISVLPLAQLTQQILGISTANKLARVIVSVGLAQNLAALKALVSEGIQKGHMSLQVKSLALSAGATESELPLVVAALLENKQLNLENAHTIIAQLRQN